MSQGLTFGSFIKAAVVFSTMITISFFAPLAGAVAGAYFAGTAAAAAGMGTIAAVVLGGAGFLGGGLVTKVASIPFSIGAHVFFRAIGFKKKNPNVTKLKESIKEVLRKDPETLTASGSFNNQAKVTALPVPGNNASPSSAPQP